MANAEKMNRTLLRAIAGSIYAVLDLVWSNAPSAANSKVRFAMFALCTYQWDRCLAIGACSLR